MFKNRLALILTILLVIIKFLNQSFLKASMGVNLEAF